jgi:hypothetical protein
VHEKICLHNLVLGNHRNFIIFFYEAIDTAATPGLLCQPRVIVKMIVEQQMECRLTGETEVLGENLLQRHFCPSQNPTEFRMVLMMVYLLSFWTLSII